MVSMIVNTINNYAIAHELLSLGARINIVADATGLSSKMLRKAYFDMHKRSPPSGSLRTNTNFIYKSFSKTKEATLFIFFFRIECTYDDFSKKCINAYKKYESYVFTVYKSKPAFDISDCWVLAKWSMCGIIKLVRCDNCRSAQLMSNNQEQTCCICKY